jgi:hypothetical protein
MNAADLTTTTAVASAVAGVGSWFSATWSLRSSRKAAGGTASLTAIEQDRRWTELTPKFRFTLTEEQNGSENKRRLEILLLGPMGLDYHSGLSAIRPPGISQANSTASSRAGHCQQLPLV